MGTACGMRWRDEKCMQHFGLKFERKTSIGRRTRKKENIQNSTEDLSDPPPVTCTYEGGRALEGFVHLKSRGLVSKSASVSCRTLSLSARHPPTQLTAMDDGCRVIDGSAHLQSRALVSQSACLSLRATRRRSCQKLAVISVTHPCLYSCITAADRHQNVRTHSLSVYKTTN